MAGRFRTLFDGMTRTEQRVLIGLILVAAAAVAVRHGFYGGRDDFQLIATYDEENKKWIRAPGAAEANAQGVSTVSGGADAPAAHLLPGGKTDLNTASEGQLISVPGLGPAKARDVISYRQQHGPFRSIEELDKVTGIGPKTIEHLRPYLAVGAPASSQSLASPQPSSSGAGMIETEKPMTAMTPAVASTTEPMAVVTTAPVAYAAQAALATTPSEILTQVESPSTQSYSAINVARPGSASSGAGNIAAPKATPGKAAEAPPAATKSASKSAEKSAGAGRININTASQSELESLPGIGLTLAARIIEYRKAHGAFKSVAELDNVSGIGPKKLGQIEALITVGGR